MIYVYFFIKCVVRWSENSVTFDNLVGIGFQMGQILWDFISQCETWHVCTQILGKLQQFWIFCLFWFNISFNNFSVISRQSLIATGSSMLTFIVLPHWSIMPQTLDKYPVTLSWHWVNQSNIYPLSLSAKAGAAIVQTDKWASSRENLSSGFATKNDSNRPVQPQKLDRGLKCRI